MDTDQERLLASEGPMGGEDRSSSSIAMSSKPHHRRGHSLTSALPEDSDNSSEDDWGEHADSALLNRITSRTSWFSTPAATPGTTVVIYKKPNISKCALCIAITGGIVVLISVIIGGGVMVLGRKPLAKSEGWYPTRERAT